MSALSSRHESSATAVWMFVGMVMFFDCVHKQEYGHGFPQDIVTEVYCSANSMDL
jgi:hypothetical protein